MESTDNNANKQNFNPSQNIRGIDVDFSQLRLADIFPNFKYEVGEAIPSREFNESLGIMVDTVIFQNDTIRLTSELYVECHMMSELYSLVREVEVVSGGREGERKKEKQEMTICVGDNLESVIRFCLERGFGIWMN